MKKAISIILLLLFTIGASVGIYRWNNLRKTNDIGKTVNNNQLAKEKEQEEMDLDNVKATYYDVETFVGNYCEMIAYSVNDNDFSRLSEYLRVDGQLYQREKLYVEENYTKGTQMVLISLGCNERTKDLGNHKYEVNMGMGYECTAQDGQKSIVNYDKKFIVYYDGDKFEILDIILVKEETQEKA